jgi:hypothetical protein
LSDGPDAACFRGAVVDNLALLFAHLAMWLCLWRAIKIETPDTKSSIRRPGRPRAAADDRTDGADGADGAS